MSTQGERSSMVAAIKDLKSEYCIGSLNAYKYLKATNWLENLLRQIHAQNPDLTKKHNLTIPFVAWLVLTTQDLLGRVLQIASAKASKPENCSIQSEHVFVPLDLHPYGNVDYDLDTRMWSIEYANLLASFLFSMNVDSDNKTTRRFLFNFLSNRFGSDRLSVKFLKTEEEILYSEFCKRSVYKGGSEQSAWVWADFLINHDKNTSGDLITDEERVILKQAVGTRDLSLAHQILQLAEIKQVRISPPYMDNQSCFSRIAEDWLYDCNLYDRAEREYILGYVHIQRGIVLSEVHKWNGHYEYLSASAFVEMLIHSQFKRIRKSVDRLSLFRSANTPSSIINKEEWILQKRRYIYTALRQNHSWLVQFLSR